MIKQIENKIGQLQYEISLLEHSKEELTGVTLRTEELKDLVKKLTIPVVSSRYSNSWNFTQYFKESKEYKRLTEVQKVEDDRISLTASKIYDWLVSNGY